MAKINKQILGKVRGSLGDITFRQRNGKTFLSTRPGSFTPGADEKSVARRGKFSLSIKLASSINSVPELRSIWDKIKTTGTLTFNHIMRTNYKIIGSENDLSGLVKITPSLGFNVANPVVTYSPSEVKVNLDAPGTATGIDALQETSLKLVAVIYLNNPSDVTLSKDAFLTLSSQAIATDLAAAIEFTSILTDEKSQMLTAYQNHKGFFAVVTLDAAGNVVHYSNTFIG
ncbi:MAG: hypothetical protein WCS69_15465 [Ignavibacteriaceae bacterium]|jgi:hypothetical protein